MPKKHSPRPLTGSLRKPYLSVGLSILRELNLLHGYPFSIPELLQLLLLLLQQCSQLRFFFLRFPFLQIYTLKRRQKPGIKP